MSPKLTDQGRERIAEIAGRYGVSPDAALCLLSALSLSGGGMAQFNHPELGGGGQWMRGGMTMVGDMFNHGLKAKVDGLCLELSALLPEAPQYQAGNFQMQSQGGASSFASGSMFTFDSTASPEDRPEFGAPAWRGAQNDMRYAYYPAARRLVVVLGGKATVYDSGDHQLQGVSQQQQNGSATLAFTSQHGVVTLASLRPVKDGEPAKAPTPAAPAEPPTTGGAIPSPEDLAGSSWTQAAGTTLTFLADGSIAGSDRQTFAYWSVEQGSLRLFAEDGRPSARFDGAKRDPAGQVLALSSSADPQLTLTRPGTKAPTAATQGTLVLNIALTEGRWELIDANGASLGQLHLLADGRIDGGRPLEARWRSDGTSLSLHHTSGRPTARFDSFHLRHGQWTLGGAFIGEDNAECVLKQV